MKSIDRAILIVLALGVWALVLEPTILVADDGHSHKCRVDASGSGNVDDDSVSLYGGFGTLDRTSVSIDLDITVKCRHR